jgi:beta-lactamase class A
LIRLSGLGTLRGVLAVGLVAGASAATSMPTQEPNALADVLRSTFASELDTIARQADGVVGYVVIDVDSGERFVRLDGVQFPTASTIKLAILYELLKQSDEGRVALDAVTPMDRSRAVPGGLLYELTSPSLSPRDLAVAMILQSDNTAANVLIDRVGMAAVNRRMAALGLSGTELRRHMIDLEAARRGDENVATPADLARLVLAFHRGEGLSEASKAAALSILQKFKPTPMRSGVPPDVVVASKSGDLEGVRADAGIVYVPGRPYVFVAMGTFLREDAQPSRALEQLARASYEYFSRRATVSRYGRQLK